jgi:hypothetical protein
MISAFDLDLETLNEVKATFSDARIERRDPLQQTQRNCEIVQSRNFVRRRNGVAFGFSAQQAELTEELTSSASRQSLRLGAGQARSNDTRIVGSFLSSYTNTPNTHLKAPSQSIPGSDSLSGGRKFIHEHTLLPLASRIFSKSMGGGKLAGGKKRPMFHPSRPFPKRWLPTSIPHSPAAKFSRPVLIPAVSARASRTRFDKLPILEKREYQAKAWDPIRFGHPTVMISLKFGEPEVRAAKANGQTIAELAYSDREAIRVFCKNSGFPRFPNMWAIETHNGVGLHIICQIPDDLGMRDRLAQLLCRRHGQPIPAGKSTLDFVTKENSGSAVHFLDIDSTPYGRTGRSGFLGLVDYTSKELLKNQKRRDKKFLGKLTGCSREINAAAIELFRSGVRLDPPSELSP